MGIQNLRIGVRLFFVVGMLSALLALVGYLGLSGMAQALSDGPPPCHAWECAGSGSTAPGAGIIVRPAPRR